MTSNQTSNGSSAQRRFVYDLWGNRLQVWDAVSGGTQLQAVTIERAWRQPPTNRIVSVTNGGVTLNYTYDAAGDVTNDGAHSYAYDAENRIVNVDGGATGQYAYDQSNQRYKKVVVGSTTHYIWQGSKVIAEHNGSTGAGLIDYVYSGSRMVAKVSSGTTQYFFNDRLSTRLVLDASGNVTGRQAHLPFGEDFGESGTQEKRHFASYERDAESGIDYAINRGYSAVMGRFLSADPYRESGCMIDPQIWDRYNYGRNNPVGFMDPLGLLIAAVNGGSLGSISVWGGDGWISADSAGFALLWAYITAGGVSTGGNTAGSTPGSGSGKVMPEDPYKDLTPCEKKLLPYMSAEEKFDLKKSRKIAEEWERQNGGPILPGGRPNDSNNTNAVKHCIWSCEMARRQGEKFAYDWGTAHECDSQGNPQAGKDSAMDLHNNEVGRFYARQFPNMDCWSLCKTDTYVRLQIAP